MTSKPKLIDTLREFERISKDAKKSAEKPSSRRIRIAFSKVLWESEINKLVHEKSMPLCTEPRFFFEEVPPKKGAEILTFALYRGENSARKMTLKLEQTADTYGYVLSIAKIGRKEALRLPGFNDFLDDCLVPLLVALKASTKDGRESHPIIFGPDTLLVQKTNGAFAGNYDPENDLSEIFNNLAFK